MRIIRSVATGATLLAMSSAFAAELADPSGSDGARSAALEAAMTVRHQGWVPPSGSSVPATIAAPSVGTLEADDAVSGSEPDPEAFDRGGLELWWQHFQEALRRTE